MIFHYFLIIVLTFSSVSFSLSNEEIPKINLSTQQEKKEDQKETEPASQKKNLSNRNARQGRGLALYDAFTKEDLERVMHLVENNVEIQEAINYAIQQGDNVNAQKLLFLNEFSRAVLSNYQTQEEKKRWMSVAAQRVSIGAGMFIIGVTTANIYNHFFKG